MKTAPPPGAWLTEHTDGFELGGKTSQSIALFGFLAVGLFLLEQFIDTFYVEQLRRWRFDPGASVVGILFVSFAAFWNWNVLMGAVGKTRISVQGDHAMLFLGVGSIGFCTRFRWSQIASLRPAPVTARRPQGGLLLVDDDGGTVAVIHRLSRDRLDFVANALYARLANAPVAHGGLYR
jgi:hypothetical protein